METGPQGVARVRVVYFRTAFRGNADRVMPASGPAGPLMDFRGLVPIQNLHDLGLGRIRNHHPNLPVIPVNLDFLVGDAGREKIVFDIFDRFEVSVSCYYCGHFTFSRSLSSAIA
jgi:hypothetical protein